LRLLVLYLRSRAAPAIVATMLACAAALGAIGLIVHGRSGRALAALVLALAASTAMGPGLSGPDHDLDKTGAIAWPAWRAIHVLAGGAAVFGLLAVPALAGERMTGAVTLARNVAGLAGLVALGAAAFGASRAAVLPVLWIVPVLWWAPPLGEPPTRPAFRVMLTWMVQPPDTRLATVAAIILAATGAIAYAACGSRR
jgi:hypothetical protein